MLSRIMLSFVYLVLFVFTHTNGIETTFVKEISQNFHKKTNSKLVQLVHSYNDQAYMYTGYASYFDRADIDLPGFKKFYLHRSKVAQELADNMTHIINERGGHVRFINLKMKQICSKLSKDMVKFPHTCYFVHTETDEELTNKRKNGENKKRPNALDALHDNLVFEKLVNEELLGVAAYVKKVGFQDPSIHRKLDDFLDVQVTIIEYLSNVITRLDSYQEGDYALGEYILDAELTYP